MIHIKPASYLTSTDRMAAEMLKGGFQETFYPIPTNK